MNNLLKHASSHFQQLTFSQPCNVTVICLALCSASSEVCSLFPLQIICLFKVSIQMLCDTDCKLTTKLILTLLLGV